MLRIRFPGTGGASPLGLAIPGIAGAPPAGGPDELLVLVPITGAERSFVTAFFSCLPLLISLKRAPCCEILAARSQRYKPLKVVGQVVVREDLTLFCVKPAGGRAGKAPPPGGGGGGGGGPPIIGGGGGGGGGGGIMDVVV